MDIINQEYNKKELEFFLHQIIALIKPMQASSNQLLISYNDNTETIDKDRFLSNIGKISNYIDIINLQISLINFKANSNYIKNFDVIGINLHKLIRTVGKSFDLSYKERKIKHRIYKPKNDVIGELKLPEIFQIIPYLILDNAYKYSIGSSIVEIHFSVYTKQRLDIEIKSIGPYVPEEELSSLFERGKRGSNAIESKISGSGLGLFYAKQICDKCGGADIDITSEYTSQINGVDAGLFTVKISI